MAPAIPEVLPGGLYRELDVCKPVATCSRGDLACRGLPTKLPNVAPTCRCGASDRAVSTSPGGESEASKEGGIITGARFGSDGKTVYYSMAHGGGPSRVYVTRTDRFESNQLEIPPGFLLTVSNKDELGMLLTNERASYAAPGTFARVPAIGGTPRPLIEGVTYADWSADGEHIAIQRANGPCEFPIGRAVTTNCALPRVSPDGKNVAFSTRNGLVVQSATGERIASSNITAVFGLAWTRDGREVWYTGSEGGSPHDRALYALSLDGRNQLLARAPGSLAVWDVSPDGRSALINTGAGRCRSVVRWSCADA